MTQRNKKLILDVYILSTGIFKTDNCNMQIRTKKILNHQSGFTLVEVMVTLAIVGLVIALAYPTMNRSLKARESLEASRELVSTIRKVRYQAGTTNYAYAIKFHNHNEGVEIFRSFDNTCINMSSVPVSIIDFEEEYDNVRIQDVQPGVARNHGICIKPDGRVLDLVSLMPFPYDSEGNQMAGVVKISIQLSEESDDENNTETYDDTKHVIKLPFNGVVRMVE